MLQRYDGEVFGNGLEKQIAEPLLLGIASKGSSSSGPYLSHPMQLLSTASKSSSSSGPHLSHSVQNKTEGFIRHIAEPLSSSTALSISHSVQNKTEGFLRHILELLFSSTAQCSLCGSLEELLSGKGVVTSVAPTLTLEYSSSQEIMEAGGDLTKCQYQGVLVACIDQPRHMEDIEGTQEAQSICIV